MLEIDSGINMKCEIENCTKEAEKLTQIMCNDLPWAIRVCDKHYIDIQLHPSKYHGKYVLWGLVNEIKK